MNPIDEWCHKMELNQNCIFNFYASKISRDIHIFTFNREIQKISREIVKVKNLLTGSNDQFQILNFLTNSNEQTFKT